MLAEQDGRDLPLAERLAPFVRAGLLPEIPTAFQQLQGQLEMAPYVILPDATDAERYVGAPLGNALLRQPVTLRNVGLDHFRTGSGLGARLDSLFAHLMFVHHADFPDYDLQLIQCHPEGTAAFRRFLIDIERGTTARHRRIGKQMAWVIPDSQAYRERFTAPGGYLDRAEAYDYPPIERYAGDERPEFSTLVRFLNHCARHYPRTAAEVGRASLPRHLLRIAMARFRN